MNWPEIRALVVAVLTAALMLLGHRQFPPPSQFNNPPIPPAPIVIQPPVTPDTRQMPIPQVPEVPKPKADPINAIVQTSAGNVGCSATIIGPRRDDGKYWVLTAGHCERSGGKNWKFRTRTGITGSFHVVGVDYNADYAWGLTDDNSTELPFAYMATRMPKIGESVWVAGFGVGYNGKKREGTYKGCKSTDGQVCYDLAVNHGDSGGGIMLASTGECLSPVCCTSRLGGRGTVWGASPEVANAGRPANVDGWDWHPLPLPERRDVVAVK